MSWSTALDKALPRPLRCILRGVGQVFFCGNAVTGFVFLIALFVGGIGAGVAATVGVLSSTAGAYLLGFSEDDIEAGLYGFNGTLVGPCLYLFLELSPQLWVYVVVASMTSSVVMAALLRVLTPHRIPVSTAPFVLTSWMFLAGVYAFDSLRRGPALPVPAVPTTVTGAGAVAVHSWLPALAKGVSEVMFADSVVVGILFLIGIAITSYRGAVMAVAGAAVGIVVPMLLGANLTAIEAGIYGFNPVLTMMAVGWVFLEPGGKSAALAVAAGVVTVVCQAALAGLLAPIGLPTLTFPFVITMWLFLLAAGKSRHWAA